MVVGMCEHKTHILSGLLALMLPEAAAGLKLRLKSGLEVESNTSEWNTKNIVGLAGAVLVLVFLFLSFLYSDQFRRKIVKLRVMQIALVSKNENTSRADTSTMSAVIKVNSDNPLHFVVPVESEIPTQPPTAAKCVFEVDALVFEQMTFSLIIRDGNIPIHFATLSGIKLISKSEPVPGSKQLRRLNIENVQEDEERLKNRQIVLSMEINK
jgi:hypothetical protein